MPLLHKSNSKQTCTIATKHQSHKAVAQRAFSPSMEYFQCSCPKSFVVVRNILLVITRHHTIHDDVWCTMMESNWSTEDTLATACGIYTHDFVRMPVIFAVLDKRSLLLIVVVVVDVDDAWNACTRTFNSHRFKENGLFSFNNRCVHVFLLKPFVPVVVVAVVIFNSYACNITQHAVKRLGCRPGCCYYCVFFREPTTCTSCRALEQHNTKRYFGGSISMLVGLQWNTFHQ